MPRAVSLVLQHLEKVSRNVLGEYQEIVRQFVKGRQGVYALYKGEHLYYVGLAGNLRNRLKQHLRDRHGHSWDRFSVYLTKGDSHLKELESLVLRILKPSGNITKGGLTGSDDLRRRFKRAIREYHREKEKDMFGSSGRAVAGDDNGRQERRVVARAGAQGTATSAADPRSYIAKVSKRLGLSFIKEGRSLYGTPDRKVGLIFKGSRVYGASRNAYWFTLHEGQLKGLMEYRKGYLVFGCGPVGKTLLLSIKEFIRLREKVRSYGQVGRRKWHVTLREKDGRMKFVTKQGSENIDLTSKLA